MSSETWKLERDLCRCCHAEGSFTSLAESSRDLAHAEIFSELLRRCFDVDIQPVEGTYNASTYTICEPCILRLRDASSFKLQVLQCEERFRDMYRNVTALGDMTVEEEDEENTIQYEFKEEPFETSDDDAVAADDGHDDEPLPKQPRLETNDDVTDQVEPQKETIGPEEITLNVDSNKNTSTDITTREVNEFKEECSETGDDDAVAADDGNDELKEEYFETSDDDAVAADDGHDDAPLPKQPRLETNDDETDQVEPQKELQGPKEITSNVDLNKNTSTHITTRQVNDKGSSSKYCNLRNRNRAPEILQNVFICNDCGKRFDNKRTLAVHIASHEELGYTAKTKYRLLNHLKLKNVHSSKILRVSNIYESRTNKISNLKKHEPYLCFVCGYKSDKRDNFRKHLRIHTGKKPYSCSFCDYKFTRKGNLTTHLRIHTGDKPYACSSCDYKTTRKNGLKRHLLVHTDGKLYSCSFCDNKFTRKDHMKRHLRIHTGEKPFSCSKCDYRSARKSNLKSHLRIHIGTK